MPVGKYNTGSADDWFMQGKGGRRFVATDGVGLYVAPVSGKGFGLFTAGAHPSGTVIGYMKGRIIPASDAGMSGKDYVSIRKPGKHKISQLLACSVVAMLAWGGLRCAFLTMLAGAAFICEDPTTDKPAWFANTATAEAENNARYVVNPTTCEVRVVLTDAVAAYQEILVDYGEEYRAKLRKANRKRKAQEKRCEHDAPVEVIDFQGELPKPGGKYMPSSPEEALAVWKLVPTARMHCPACNRLFYWGKGRAHVLNCGAGDS